MSKQENSKNTQPIFTSVLEPVLCPVDSNEATTQQGSKIKPSVSSQRTNHFGPWSLDWLSQVPVHEGGKVFTVGTSVGAAQPSISKEIIEQPLVWKQSLKKRTTGSFKHSMGFMKRVARMPSADRKEILKVLKKQDHKRKSSKVSQTFKGKAANISTSEPSKNSSSTVNNDWANWVLAHGNPEGVAKDVKDIGKVIGVSFKGDPNNSFNLLTRARRREWRAARGTEVTGEGVGGLLSEGDGC